MDLLHPLNPINPLGLGCPTGTFCLWPKPDQNPPKPTETKTEVRVPEPVHKAPDNTPTDVWAVLFFVVLLLTAVSAVLAILFNGDN